MDISIHWGVLRHLRQEVQANVVILVTAIALDAVVLGAFLFIKAASDVLIIIISLLVLALVVAAEWYFLRSRGQPEKTSVHGHRDSR